MVQYEPNRDQLFENFPNVVGGHCVGVNEVYDDYLYNGLGIRFQPEMMSKIKYIYIYYL